MSIDIPVFSPHREDQPLFEFPFTRQPQVGDKIVREETLYEIKEIRHLEDASWAVTAVQTHRATLGFWQACEDPKKEDAGKPPGGLPKASTMVGNNCAAVDPKCRKTIPGYVLSVPVGTQEALAIWIHP